MIFKPFLLTGEALSRDELAMDKKSAAKFGRCGVGDKAIYLGSFYIDRMYYAPISQVVRAYKRVAMTKGGFTGQGAFGTMSYLVVDFADGSQKVSNFKSEEQLDQLIDFLKLNHPEIMTVSPKVAQRQAEIEASRFVYNDGDLLEKASEKQKEEIYAIDREIRHLEKNPEIYKRVASLAKELRRNQMTSSNNKWVAMAIVILGVAAAVYGVITLINHGEFAIYFLLFGLAAIFLFSATAVMPTARKNKKAIEDAFQESLVALNSYLKALKGDLVIPSTYGNPLILQRIKDKMAQKILESDDKKYYAASAFEDIKAELRAATREVKVSQDDYNFITAVKPIFLVRNYE